MERQLRMKKVITVIAVCLLIAVYIMIFLFSADDAAESSSLSVSVTRKLINLYYHFFSGNNNAVLTVPVVTDDAEAIVRKMAHFTEYMAVGFLSFGIAVIWMQRIKAGIVAVTLQVFLSAGLDEIHQYFVPGRYASFRDVLIDTAGGIAGIMIVFLMYKIRKRRR
ncbi:MAG: VanZ family protein [Lachnospiraceae bacterium]|nr:VanZ family protein [Lachnospiraceae bacterium]MDD7626703.1 VanZ family protein [Lachnospiraceae bacterium]MDY4117917.1 VanZ family protein [Lachnospiraceae bacterium]